MAAFPSALLLSFLLLLLSPSSANEGNLIVTGDVLPTDGQLTVPKAAFVIQDDCNLVLYNKGTGFESDTSGLGRNCTASLSQYGQLQIKNGLGKSIWSTPVIGPKGEYAAILQPNGQVGIYGPSLWSTRQFRTRDSFVDDSNSTDKISNEPKVPNLLFSSEVLNEEWKLVSRDYALEVKEGCSLEFTKASLGVLWARPRNRTTAGGGHNCFIRLSFRGQLSLVDDNYRVLWQTKPAYKEGVYVLVVKIEGEAVIYGRRIWSTDDRFLT